jgi:hypothetical protein
MMSCVTRGVPHSVAPVGSHPLPTVPIGGQSCDAALLSRIVKAYPQVLQVMMTPPVYTSSKHLDNV